MPRGLKNRRLYLTGEGGCLRTVAGAGSLLGRVPIILLAADEAVVRFYDLAAELAATGGPCLGLILTASTHLELPVYGHTAKFSKRVQAKGAMT